MLLCSEKRKNFFYIILLSLSAFLLINNAFYAFGWTDEALYTATANSLYHGNRLFFDIFEPTQIYSVLVYPLFYIFVKLSGSTDGIYLFMRIATIIIQFATSVFVFFILSKKYKKTVSFIASFIVLVFSRAQLFGPSYYTFVLVNFTIANILIFYVFELKAKSVWLFVSGIFHGFAILCNPYLVLPYAAFSLCCVILPSLRKYIKKYILIWAGTVLIGTMFLIFVLKNRNLKEFQAALTYFFSSPEYSSKTIVQKIKWLLKFPRLLITQFIYFLPFTVLAVISFFKKNIKEKINLTKNKTILLLLLFINYIIQILFIKKDNGMPITGFFAVSILSFFLFNSKKLKDLKKELLYFLVPGLSLSFVACLASDTGFGVFSIGIAACMPFAASLYFDTFCLKSSCKTEKYLFALPLCLLIFGTLYYRVNLTYRDARISPHYIFIPQIENNITKIERGPAKGIWTHKNNKIQYDSIYSAIKNIKSDRDDYLMVLKLCPWAYLINDRLKPFSMTAWRVSDNDLRLKPYFEEFHHKFPEHILVLNKNIRDNDNNEIEDDSYLITELKKQNYESKEIDCGTLWEKR